MFGIVLEMAYLFWDGRCSVEILAVELVVDFGGRGGELCFWTGLLREGRGLDEWMRVVVVINCIGVG